jgi:hypothetical protein
MRYAQSSEVAAKRKSLLGLIERSFLANLKLSFA